MTNNFLPKFINPKGKCFQLYKWWILPENKDKKLKEIDFFTEESRRNLNLPKVGAKPGSRLSELKGKNLAYVCGKYKGKQKGTRPMNIYALTEEAFNYKL